MLSISISKHSKQTVFCCCSTHRTVKPVGELVGPLLSSTFWDWRRVYLIAVFQLHYWPSFQLFSSFYPVALTPQKKKVIFFFIVIFWFSFLLSAACTFSIISNKVFVLGSVLTRGCINVTPYSISGGIPLASNYNLNHNSVSWNKIDTSWLWKIDVLSWVPVLEEGPP